MKRNDSLKSISAVMVIMLVGKLLSLVANQAYLSYFGSADEQLNIFSWVLQIPNYLFQSLGTALASVVIPVFAALCAEDRREDADRFGSNLLVLSTMLTLALMAVGMVLSLILPGFTEFEDKAYAGTALRILMPVVVFYGLTHVYQGILQSLGHFVAPALVNLPSGIVILLYLWLLADRFGVTGLLWAVVLGLFLQAAILIPPARRAGFRFRPVLDLRDEHIRTAGKMMVPIILGASAYQFNMFFNNTMMASVAPQSVSLFNFVQTLILTSVMTLVLAVTSVIYPALTDRAARNDMAGFKDTMSSTMGGLLYLLIPITAGLAVLGRPLLTLVSLHGRMLPADIGTETLFLLMYCPCIAFLGLKEVADRSFYSLKTTRVSAVTGVVIMASNIVLGWVLSRFTPLGAAGIPLAYSLSVSLGTVFLLVMLRRKIGPFGGRLGETAVKSLLCAAVMGLAVDRLHALLSSLLTGDSIPVRLALVLVPTAAGAALFFLLTFLLRTPPILAFFGKFTGRKDGRP